MCEELAEHTQIELAALHKVASGWLAEHVSPEWLCSESQNKQELLATFRRRIECLALLDLADVATVERAFGAELQPAWVACLHDVVDTSDWCGEFQVQVALRPGNLHVLCLKGSKVDRVVPCRPLKASVYKLNRQRSTVVQDAITLFFRLWRCPTSVVIILTDVDPDIGGCLA